MDVDISYEIERLLQYGLEKKLIYKEDIVYTRNKIMEVLGIEDINEVHVKAEGLYSPEPILRNILKWASEKGVFTDAGVDAWDLFDTKIMGCLMGRPSEIISTFFNIYRRDKKEATDYFYSLSKASNYIRTDRIAKDMKWKTPTEYGELDITINLSKPEKDPRAIAEEKNLKTNSYPKCLLCKENEGYSGKKNHPARQNHRIIPITINNENWFFQYSPYVYYNEHCIVFKSEHQPMKISRETFCRLLDFVEQFPHYFIGSNADLPIVGGSILSHDHFQGGNYEFAMTKAPVEKEYTIGYGNKVKAYRIKWPMSVIRLEAAEKSDLIEVAYQIYLKWKNYSDIDAGIISHTNGIPHNTVTPIARMVNGKFQLDLVLRNNRISEEFPYGIFHPHQELHHIKKENIGLIEVMGLAVLPARLNNEIKELADYLVNPYKLPEIDKNEKLLKHKEWAIEINRKYGTIGYNEVEGILKNEVGQKFLRVLEHSGVFKRDADGQNAFNKFMAARDI